MDQLASCAAGRCGRDPLARCLCGGQRSLKCAHRKFVDLRPRSCRDQDAPARLVLEVTRRADRQPNSQTTPGRFARSGSSSPTISVPAIRVHLSAALPFEACADHSGGPRPFGQCRRDHPAIIALGRAHQSIRRGTSPRSTRRCGCGLRRDAGISVRQPAARRSTGCWRRRTRRGPGSRVESDRWACDEVRQPENQPACSGRIGHRPIAARAQRNCLADRRESITPMNAMMRVRLKADGRLVEILADGSERAIAGASNAGTSATGPAEVASPRASGGQGDDAVMPGHPRPRQADPGGIRGADRGADRDRAQLGAGQRSRAAARALLK